MGLEELELKVKKLEMLSQLNSMIITDEQGNRRPLLKMNENDIEYVDEEVSIDEYSEDKVAFINKILQKIPLVKKGSEKKSKLEEKDFIQYS